MKAEIIDYGMNGEGVAKLEGKVCLIPNSIKGEIVECQIKEDYKNYSICALSNIITSSNNRVEPKCRYFNICGGCKLQHMSYAEQLNFKTDLVKKTIKKIAGIDASVDITIGSNKEYNYRNKASFSVKDLSCGYLIENTNQIVPIERCEIVDERMNVILNEFCLFLNRFGIKSIRNLVIRIISDQILIGIVSRENLDIKPFYKQLKTLYPNMGVSLIINKRKDSVVLTDNIVQFLGLSTISTINKGMHYSIDILGFHQTNLDIQDKIYSFVLDCVGQNETVVNGFSGQGLLSAILAKKAKHVYGVEINKSSHIQAQKLKGDNQISNLTNILGDFNKTINSINGYDTIVLDPSKKGCGEILKNINSNKIIYISCNPIALSKDLRFLLDRYKIETIQPFDMFPQTISVETVVVLKRLPV